MPWCSASQLRSLRPHRYWVSRQPDWQSRGKPCSFRSTAPMTMNNGNAVLPCLKRLAQSLPIFCHASICSRRKTRAATTRRKSPLPVQTSDSVNRKPTSRHGSSTSGAHMCPDTKWQAMAAGTSTDPSGRRTIGHANFPSMSGLSPMPGPFNGEREPFGWRAAASTFAIGFRAPYLATGKGLETALQQGGFAFDASTVSKGISPIAAQNSGIARFALPTLPEGPQGRRIISMDYNLFVRHSGGFERHDDDSAFEQRTYEMLKAGFRRTIQRPTPAGAVRPAFHVDERWRLLARGGALRARGLHQGGCRLHDLFSLSQEHGPRRSQAPPGAHPRQFAVTSACCLSSHFWSISGSGSLSITASKARRRL